MEEVLEAVADNVATIVLALSQTDRVFGNIVPAAELIKSSVDGMCEAAKVTAKSQAIQPDAKQVLEDTAGQLSVVTARLVENAVKARDDPAARAEAQREAIKAAKDMLQKVVLLVMLEDQMNIQTFVQSAKRAVDVIRRINCVESPQQLAVVLPEATLHHQDFLKRARRRTELTKAGEAKSEMQSAIEVLAAGTPRHLLSAQAMAVTPSEQTKRDCEDAGQVLISAIDRLIAVVKEVFARNAKFIGAAFAFKVPAPTTTREDDVARHAAAMRSAAEKIVPAVVSGQDPTAAARAFLTGANQLLAASRRLALECNDPTKRRMIERCAEEVSDLLPRLVAAVKPAADQPQNAALLAELRALTGQVRDAGDMLQTAATATPEATVALGGALVMRNVADMRKAIEAGDQARAKAELRNLERNFDRYVALAGMMAEQIQDPLLRDTALKAVEALKALRPKLLAAAQAAIENPRDPTAIRMLDECIAQLQQATAVISAPHLTAAALSGIIARELDALLDTLSRKDANYQQDAVEHAKAAASAMQNLLATAAKVLETVQDPARRAQIEASMARAKDLVAKLLEAVKVCLKNPDSREAREALEAVTDQTKKAVTELAALLRPTPEEIAAENERIRRLVERQKAEEEAERRRIAEREEAAAEAERKRIAEKHRAEEAAAAEAERKRIAEKHRAEEAAAEAERKRIAEKRRAEEEALLEIERKKAEAAKRLAVEGPHDARIMAAAQQVESSVPTAAMGDGTPQGRLLQFSHDIAGLMAQLSAFAQQGNKQGMIQTSRKIAAAVNDIWKIAQEIAAKCTDTRLRTDVLNYAQACQNWSVQLKIMSAVKAASEELDPTIQDQLVTAATGLAASVVNTANSCISASIHKSVRSAK